MEGRRGERVALSFDFPFYGHRVRQITIATGGKHHTASSHRLKQQTDQSYIDSASRPVPTTSWARGVTGRCSGHEASLGDTQTGPPHPRMTENTAIIAGVVAALVVLVVLTLLAVYYINTHPTVAPPFYLMQRRTNNYWPSMKFRNQGCHSTYAEVEIGVHEKEGFIEAEHCC
ncbi:unnamed protein product [Boreogadus saida]